MMTPTRSRLAGAHDRGSPAARMTPTSSCKKRGNQWSSSAKIVMAPSPSLSFGANELHLVEAVRGGPWDVLGRAMHKHQHQHKDKQREG